MTSFCQFICIFLIPAFCFESLEAQELFVFSEPASNMPAHSLGIRASNWFENDKSSATINYQLNPELMWGVNQHLMVHLEGELNNQEGSLHAVGAGSYFKYRVYAADGVNRHFRLAVFGRINWNNSILFQEEIDLTRYNTGWAGGLVATQLLHKQAVSATVSFNKAYNNGPENKIPPGQSDEAMNFSLSTGRLILPAHYVSYKQTNMNLMLELMGQYLMGSNKNFIDLAPAVQFIFNSQTRLDIGYKVQLYSDMQRTDPNGILIRVEHLIFNL